MLSQQQRADSNQTTIWHHQPLTLVRSTLMVRATASSPSDMSHLRTLSIEAENPTINESDENTRTLIQQQKS
jgi:hypothetical protein